MLRTVTDLLAAVDRLPPAERAEARDRIDAALEGDARTCRAALGLLALDLSTPVATATSTPRLEVKVNVIALDDDRAPVAASA